MTRRLDFVLYEQYEHLNRGVAFTYEHMLTINFATNILVHHT